MFRNAEGVPTHRAEVHSYEDSTRLSFMKSLRPICEAFYQLLLSGYLNGLENYHDRCVALAAEEGNLRSSPPAWASAISSPREALEMAVKAADLAQVGTEADLVEAGVVAEYAYARLSESLENSPEG